MATPRPTCSRGGRNGKAAAAAAPGVATNAAMTRGEGGGGGDWHTEETITERVREPSPLVGGGIRWRCGLARCYQRRQAAARRRGRRRRARPVVEPVESLGLEGAPPSRGRPNHFSIPDLYQ